MRNFSLGICTLFISLSLSWSPRVLAVAVTDCYANLAITRCGLTPSHVSQLYAMMHLAILLALYTINRRFSPYVLYMLVPEEIRLRRR